MNIKIALENNFEVTKEPLLKMALDRIEELEKEVAELRKGLSVVNASNSFNKAQLNEAKDIIREFTNWADWQSGGNCPSFKMIKDKAEQFLKEE